MPSRRQPQVDLADTHGNAAFQGLTASFGIIGIAGAHDGQRLGRGQDVLMAGPRVVGMTMGDDRAIDRSGRVDEEPAGHDVQAGRADLDPVLRSGRHDRHRGAARLSNRWTGHAPRGVGATRAQRRVNRTPVPVMRDGEPFLCGDALMPAAQCRGCRNRRERRSRSVRDHRNAVPPGAGCPAAGGRRNRRGAHAPPRLHIRKRPSP